MVRTLTSNVQDKVDQDLGTEPIIVLKIEWESGTVYYADKTITIGAISCVGGILKFDTVVNSERSDNLGEISTISVVLTDVSGDLKVIYNTDVIENTAITVYHYYVGTTQSDLTTIFKGNVINPVIWTEGTRELAFEAESVIASQEVGYAPDEGDITNLATDAIGVPWPMAFGTAIHVPCVKIKKQPRGTLRYGINHNWNSFVIDGGIDFPQTPTSVSIFVGKIKYTGTFDGNTFTATSKNDAKYTNISLADRVIDDPYYSDARCIWLDSDEYIKGLFCIVNHATYGWMVNRCTGQKGRQCWFQKPWRPNNTPLGIILNSDDTITEAAAIPRGSWAATYVLEAQFWYVDNNWDPRDGYIVGNVYLQDSWGINAGSDVRLVVDYDDLYVANLLPSYEILDVFAYRKDGEDRVFVPIPSSYYTVNLSNSLDGNNATTLEFAEPLEDQEEGWEDTVYVSLRSTKGPNAADIIKYIIDTYTNFSMDSTSYSDVRSKVGAYWANFAIFEKVDAVEFCENIAWQSRIAMVIRSGVVYLKYLSEIPTADVTLEEEDVELSTLQLSFKRTEDIYTKLTGKYLIDYSGRPEAEKHIIYENNTDVFKTREKEIDFYTYNVEEFVKLSLYWWGYRYSNSWRFATLACFLRGLELETFDTLAHAIDIFSTNTIRGQVINVNHDSADHSIAIETMLASKAGDVDGSDQPDEDTNFWIGDPDFNVNTPIDPDDPGDDRDEIDYEIPPYTNNPDDPDGNTGPGPTPTYNLKFVYSLDEVQRGENFTLRVEARDSLDILQPVNISATLQLISSDGSDVLNTSNIELVGGVWESSTVQITGGSSDDSGSIIVASADYTSDTIEFDIIDALSSLVWYTYPSSVTRGTPFSVDIIGGSDSLVLAVSLNSTDSGDKLYDASGEVTEITLDGSGQYTASDWYIDNGTIDAVGSITLHDATRVYEDATCPQFDISDLGVQAISQSLSMDDGALANSSYVEIVAPDYIASGDAFELTVNYKDANGDVDTSFNGEFAVEILDSAGLGFHITDAGPDAQLYGSFMICKATSGVWTYSACKATEPSGATSPAYFYAGIWGEEYTANDTAPIQNPYFIVTAPSILERGEDFSITIKAYNGDDTADTDYVPATSLTLAWTLSDGSDVATPITINNTGWSGGVKTITTANIDGGSGEDTYDLTVTDASQTARNGEADGEITSSNWIEDEDFGPYPGNISCMEIHNNDVYGVAREGKLYRRDGYNNWTLIVTADRTISIRKPSLLDYDGTLFLTGGSSSAARVWRLSGSSLVTEITSSRNDVACLQYNDTALFWAATTYSGTSKDGARRDGASSWTWDTGGSHPYFAIYFDGAIHIGLGYYSGTTTLTFNSVSGGPTIDCQMTVYDDKLFSGYNNTTLKYKTAYNSSWSSLTSMPAGNKARHCWGASNGLLYVYSSNTSTGKEELWAWNGSTWSKKVSDMGDAATWMIDDGYALYVALANGKVFRRMLSAD